MEGSNWVTASNYLPSCENSYLIPRHCRPRSSWTKADTRLIIRSPQDTRALCGKSLIDSGRARALKLATLEDYQDRSYLEEIQRTAKLEGHEVFARLEDAGTVTLDVPGHPRHAFIGFVEEWIDGVTLKEFLDDSLSDVSSSFMVSYVCRTYLGFVWIAG